MRADCSRMIKAQEISGSECVQHAFQVFSVRLWEEIYRSSFFPLKCYESEHRIR